MKANLIITDSYFNVFPLLTERLKGKANDLVNRNFVFCEEKLSLMVERAVCDSFGGSFNTEVYSFGNFLRTRRTLDRVLSKEGSAMAVKKILSALPLKRLNKGKANLAPSLYELISQLKSAKVLPEDAARAAESSDGILAAKLADISAVYSAYENYLAENSLADQSSALNLLPETIVKDVGLAGANAFIAGFTGFTAQMRQVISAILKTAGETTAILTAGENGFAFVNETAAAFRAICKNAGVSLNETRVSSVYSAGGSAIKDGLFNPLYRSRGENPTARFLAARNVFTETERIAEVIARKVINGENRYRDFTVIVPDGDDYREAVSENFARLCVPYFLDVKRKPENFPVVSLIYSYAETFYRGWKIPVLAEFFKNPYVCDDRDFTDGFENYLYKYDISYGKFKKPFVYPTASGDDEERLRYDGFRERIVSLLTRFDADALLDELDAERKTEEMSARLKTMGENEDAEVNSQAFAKVKDILKEMKFVLSDLFDPQEFKVVFASGVAAMEISVIPQYKDAVFVGNFRQAALAKADYVFAAGLTSAVPNASEDSALLTDADIDALAEIKVLIEPKIKVVNLRRREEVALGLAAYGKGLFLSYPIADLSGAQTVKSEILGFAEKRFSLTPFPPYDGYTAVPQGNRSFARDCNRFASLILKDFSVPSAFYSATGGAPEKTVNYANKQTARVKINGGALPHGALSPTTIEDYYACPYRSFVSHILKVQDRDEGKVNALSVGNLMHDIFKEYIARADEATDDAKQAALFKEIAAATLAKEDYAKFDGEENEYRIKLALAECEKYCRKMTDWYRISAFHASDKDLEVQFGDGKDCRYPAVALSGGRAKLVGKIDRIDTCGDRFRVIDYKTGGSETDDSKIYAGVKMQLYLYSLAVTDKTLAGAYYLRVNDEYKAAEDKNGVLVEGKTAEGAADGEEDFIPVGKNKTLKDSSLASIREYVRKMAEQAARQMENGVIVPSPFGETCDYCDYTPMCRGGLKARTVRGVDAEFIERSAASVADYDTEDGQAETKGGTEN